MGKPLVVVEFNEGQKGITQGEFEAFVTHLNKTIGLYTAGAYPFDNPANALKAIFYERTLELGLEGHRAYDAIRFGAEDNTTDAAELNGYLQYESKLRGFVAGASYSRNPDALIPIPQQAVENSFKDGKVTLKQNPGY